MSWLLQSPVDAKSNSPKWTLVILFNATLSGPSQSFRVDGRTHPDSGLLCREPRPNKASWSYKEKREYYVSTYDSSSTNHLVTCSACESHTRRLAVDATWNLRRSKSP